mmetsp:Transcript_57274/g.133949  ORF Transcript_57274/g.133949 Transcript_57274/m.133949 type:complete len:212 (-) Transcript_57274:2215-2850(-)
MECLFPELFDQVLQRKHASRNVFALKHLCQIELLVHEQGILHELQCRSTEKAHRRHQMLLTVDEMQKRSFWSPGMRWNLAQNHLALAQCSNCQQHEHPVHLVNCWRDPVNDGLQSMPLMLLQLGIWRLWPCKSIVSTSKECKDTIARGFGTVPLCFLFEYHMRAELCVELWHSALHPIQEFLVVTLELPADNLLNQALQTKCGRFFGRLFL